MPDDSAGTVTRLSERDSTYAHFRSAHLSTNSPCIFPPALVAEWALFDTWFTREDRCRLDYDYLRREYGTLAIECSDAAVTTFGQLVDLWQSDRADGVYLRDWHLALELDRLGGKDEVARVLYCVPRVCLDDWMNEFEGSRSDRLDDFRFIYAGGRSTYTPLHRDVYGSYSISTQIHGRKRWYLFPPALTPHLEPLLVDAHRTSQPINCDEWSDQLKLHFTRLGMVTVEQARQETIFVPSGWYHSVHNLSHPTVSLNHNWLNAHNLAAVYRALADEVERCRDAIDDVRVLIVQRDDRDGAVDRDGPAAWKPEWEAEVDQLVERSEGWSWTTFWKMVANTLASLEVPEAELERRAETSRWPVIPAQFRPPTSFVLDQVRPLLKEFRNREDQEWRWLDGLEQVLTRIDRDLNRLSSSSSVRSQG